MKPFRPRCFAFFKNLHWILYDYIIIFIHTLVELLPVAIVGTDSSHVTANPINTNVETALLIMAFVFLGCKTDEPRRSRCAVCSSGLFMLILQKLPRGYSEKKEKKCLKHYIDRCYYIAADVCFFKRRIFWGQRGKYKNCDFKCIWSSIYKRFECHRFFPRLIDWYKNDLKTWATGRRQLFADYIEAILSTFSWYKNALLFCFLIFSYDTCILHFSIFYSFFFSFSWKTKFDSLRVSFLLLDLPVERVWKNEKQFSRESFGLSKNHFRDVNAFFSLECLRKRRWKKT